MRGSPKAFSECIANRQVKKDKRRIKMAEEECPVILLFASENFGWRQPSKGLPLPLMSKAVA